MSEELNINASASDNYGNPILNIEEDSSLSIDTSAVENYASPVLVVDDATADYVAYIEINTGSSDLANYYTKEEVDGIIQVVDNKILATKEDVSNLQQVAHQVVNVGTQNSLSDAIAAIKTRVPLQIVTFINKSKAKKKKIILWFGQIPSDGQLRIFIGNASSEWFNMAGATIEKRNRLVYDNILNDFNIGGFIHSSSFSANYHQMIFTLSEAAGDADITCEQRNNSSIASITTYNISSEYSEGLESYQFKLNYQASMADIVFENVANWEHYNKDNEDEYFWEEF